MSKDRLIHSVTGILKVQDKVFCIKRSNELKAFPGYLAFPGGKVEEKDQETCEAFLEKIRTSFPHFTLNEETSILIQALKRELEEELGFYLEQEIEKNIIDLKFVMKAIAPSFNPIRFETDFFLVELEQLPRQFNYNYEVQEGMWLDQSTYMELRGSGTVFMVPPIRIIFDKIYNQSYDFQVYDEIISDDRLYSTSFIHALKQVLVPSNTLEPFFHTNCFIIGDEKKKVMIDPSPRNEQVLDLVVELAKQEKISHLFITHHHKDHCEYLFELVEKTNLPVIWHQKTSELVIKRDSRLNSIKTELVDEGDYLVDWNGEKVSLLHIPGHAPGQLALLPESKSWCLVSDLFQGHGSVVIGTETGNLNDYINSLKKIIDLEPGCVIPSHGIPLGGTKILQKIKFHREYRHQQIIKLIEQKKSIEEMVESLYFGLSDQLQMLGKANIQAHIIKIMEDKELIRLFHSLEKQETFLKKYLFNEK